MTRFILDRSELLHHHLWSALWGLLQWWTGFLHAVLYPQLCEDATELFAIRS